MTPQPIAATVHAMVQIDIEDPRQLDGEAHEVAELAGQNLVKLLDGALEATENFLWAARGAWMSAEEHRTGDMPDGHTFPDIAQGTQITAIYDELRELRDQAAVLKLAASWNPRGPLVP